MAELQALASFECEPAVCLRPLGGRACPPASCRFASANLTRFAGLSPEDIDNAIAALTAVAEDEREPERYRESYRRSLEAFATARRAMPR
jgi:hypothetical protein